MKVKLTITSSSCRGGYHHKGETFIIEDICPPLCTELWHNIYPYVFALRNGASLDCGEEKQTHFTSHCPDGGRVEVYGEVIE